MPDCCDPRAYRHEFDEEGADRLARAYRRKGLGGSARGLAGFLVSRGVEGMTVLEVGGGVGEVQIELLGAGAASAVNIELSDGYERAARDLLAEKGLIGKVERRIGDFVEEAGYIDPADIVVLNRVICCYPWMEPMVDAAVAKAHRFLALSFPRDHMLSHIWLGVENLFQLVRRAGFRGYLHPVAGIEARVDAAGLTAAHSAQSLIWEERVFQRS